MAVSVGIGQQFGPSTEILQSGVNSVICMKIKIGQNIPGKLMSCHTFGSDMGRIVGRVSSSKGNEAWNNSSNNAIILDALGASDDVTILLGTNGSNESDVSVGCGDREPLIIGEGQ